MKEMHMWIFNVIDKEKSLTEFKIKFLKYRNVSKKFSSKKTFFQKNLCYCYLLKPLFITFIFFDNLIIKFLLKDLM